MSPVKLVSGARLSEDDSKATKRPSRLIAGAVPPALASAPPVATLTRVVVPVWRSRTKTSGFLFRSPETRFVASDEKATKRPSALIAGSSLSWSPSTPELDWLTSSVNPGTGRAAAEPATMRAPAVASAARAAMRMFPPFVDLQTPAGWPADKGHYVAAAGPDCAALRMRENRS